MHSAETNLALSIDDFCARSGLRKSHVYAEVRLGRLRARKAGRRVVILVDDARAYLEQLPAAAETAA